MPTKRCVWDLDHKAQGREAPECWVNSTDTDWSVFNYYRSKLHSQPNPPRYSFLLTMSAFVAMVQLELGPITSKCHVCCMLANAQRRQLATPYSKSLLTLKLLKNSVPSVALLGGKLPNKVNKWCHINDILPPFIKGAHGSRCANFPQMHLHI